MEIFTLLLFFSKCLPVRRLRFLKVNQQTSTQPLLCSKAAATVAIARYL